LRNSPGAPGLPARDGRRREPQSSASGARRIVAVLPTGYDVATIRPAMPIAVAIEGDRTAARLGKGQVDRQERRMDFHETSVDRHHRCDPVAFMIA